jgi:hypothetical protein
MLRRSLGAAVKLGVVAFLGFVLLFADGVWRSSIGFTGSVLREVTTVLLDPEEQWMVFLCLMAYFATFFCLRSPWGTIFAWIINPNLWLACVLLISAVIYALHYSPSTQALTLLMGAVLVQGAAVWTTFNSRKLNVGGGNVFRVLAVSLFVILLLYASLWSADFNKSFEYQGHARWSGPWDNPNIAGLLMAVGMVLAVGLFVQILISKIQGLKTEKTASGVWYLAFGRFASIILCPLAVILMGHGLLHSYSRGAWLATFCGVGYLTFQALKCQVLGSSKLAIGNRQSAISYDSCLSWLKSNWSPFAVVSASVFMLTFWHFQQSDWHLARRALSAVDPVDFSWRNRVAAWEGALKITAEHSWFGTGWSQPEPLYEYYYLPPKLTESAAIEMNDYLMLGATLGIPALFCFGMYLWLSLTQKSGVGINSLELRTLDCSKIVCHAGVIALLVGFWFDGGLFKLPTAATFWILLELGTVQSHHKTEKSAQ